jgi:hypothetical protein
MEIHDDVPWTPGDIEDIRASIEHGRPVEEIAGLLCRPEP